MKIIGYALILLAFIVLANEFANKNVRTSADKRSVAVGLIAILGIAGLYFKN